MNSRTLILGTCYIDPDAGAQRYGGRMVRLWADLAVKLNPQTDILLVDSASPVDVYAAVGFKPPQVSIMRLADNIGHINTTGRDGWGRAFSIGAQWAIQEGYDYVVYMDADIVMTRPIGPIVDKMARSGVKAACPWDTQYNFLENGICFLDVRYLAESRFIERYDWPSRGRLADPMMIPELVFERLLDDVLFTLPLRGMRDDQSRLTANNLQYMFPYGIDYLTHCRDFHVYKRLLEIKEIDL